MQILQPYSWRTGTEGTSPSGDANTFKFKDQQTRQSCLLRTERTDRNMFPSAPESSWSTSNEQVLHHGELILSSKKHDSVPTCRGRGHDGSPFVPSWTDCTDGSTRLDLRLSVQMGCLTEAKNGNTVGPGLQGDVRLGRGRSVPSSACGRWWVGQAPLWMCAAPAPARAPAKGIPAVRGRAPRRGAPANKHTCFMLCATFFAGAPVKITHGQPSLPQRKRLRKGDTGCGL